MKYFIASNRSSLYAEATGLLARAAAAGEARIALSGGSTPLGWFDHLARAWRPPAGRQVDFYWVDERRVPHQDAESNFGNAWRHWLKNLTAECPQVRLHPLDEAHRQDYREGLRFDQVWLGVGPDGHTASWFPGAAACLEDRFIAEVPAPVHVAPMLPRLTLTLKAVLAAREIVILCTGRDRHERIFAALGVKPPTPEHPVSLLAEAADRLTLLYCE